jgi:hypothetical protein
MHTRTKVVIAAGALVAVAGALALGTPFAGERGRGGWHPAQAGWGGGWHHGLAGGMMSGRGWSMLEQFDADGDGKVTQAEVDAVRAERFAAFDQDGDGRLSLEEYQALWLDAMRRRMVDQFQALDDDGDAAVTVEEFVAPFARVITRLDANGDGELTADELRARHRAGERRPRRGEPSDG